MCLLDNVTSVLTCLFGSAGFFLRGRVHSYYVRKIANSWLERTMEANYDEDLSENTFLQELQQEHALIFQRAINEGWIVCVPRRGSIPKGALVKDDILSHVLIPGKEQPVSYFHSLSGREVKLSNRVLTMEYDVGTNCSSHLLFEETFYTEDLRKYRVWCIEHPLQQNFVDSKESISLVTNLRDCVDLLWTEVMDKNILRELDSGIDNFQKLYIHLESETLDSQRDLVRALYTKSLRTVFKDMRIRERTTSSHHFLQILKIAVETYILHGLHKILPRSVSSCTASEDAALNKTIKNLCELQPRDLGIRADLYDGVLAGKLELSRLDGHFTVLGKLGCLKRAVGFASRGKSSVSSDDLLPVLVFLVIRAGLPNWISQLAFMKQFRFSANSNYETDEAGFLVTSLEAAVEHVKSGVLIGSGDLESDATSLDQSSMHTFLESKKESGTSLSYLFKCARNGDSVKVDKILSKKKCNAENEKNLCHPLCLCETCDLPTVNSRDDRGLTVLHVASLYNRINVLETLLLHEANVNEADADGLTSLHCAAARGHQNTLLLLLHANADPLIVDMRGNTPLHLAADNGHKGCVKALLYFAEQARLFLDPSPVNYNGDTPLHHASKWGYSGIVEILLEHNADPRASNRRGQTPLAVAHSAVISRLLEAGISSYPHSHTRCKPIPDMSFLPPSPRPRSLASSESISEASTSTRKIRKVDRLLTAVRENDVRLACYYLGLECSYKKPSERVKNLCHPLCNCELCASSDDNYEENQQCSPVGINSCDGDGMTALHVASASSSIEVVQLLLDAGADLGSRTRSEGSTALHLACINDRLHVVKLLLKSGSCDVNVRNSSGDTPLHLAVKMDNHRMVETLVRHGADARIRNARGVTPLEEAEHRRSVDVVKILKER
ncbi:ankyrin repeat domain-containing protein 27 [Cephus cinctus]|uniref:Ankyrin repeat domain-containing protein 27 n=1 Tax=Cephus cinctus TaxID=211228 RepID=A0AAJ7FF17_CEPCN|nr:ankyrin repeat domain-containing protein 27 [Cephus cinctus]XP_015588611.1 ankyrin repeat domain-containing protein 27 [Cephus cinctus]